jgi:hypothetical protein
MEKPGHRAGPNRAVFFLGEREHGVEPERRIGRSRDADELLRLRIASREPFPPRSHPEAPAPVFEHRRHLTVGQPVLRSGRPFENGAEEIATRVEPVDSASPRSRPRVSGRVDQDARESIGRQAVGPRRVVAIPSARPARGVVGHETSVPRRYPEHTARFDRDRRDDGSVLAGRQLRKRHVMQGSVGRVEAVQCALSPEPEGARRIFCDGERGRIRLGAPTARERQPVMRRVVGRSVTPPPTVAIQRRPCRSSFSA